MKGKDIVGGNGVVGKDGKGIYGGVVDGVAMDASAVARKLSGGLSKSFVRGRTCGG